MKEFLPRELLALIDLLSQVAGNVTPNIKSRSLRDECFRSSCNSFASLNPRTILVRHFGSISEKSKLASLALSLSPDEYELR